MTQTNNIVFRAIESIKKDDVITLILGKAGTGKTTFIRKLASVLQENLAVVAPTGIAAQNTNGQTIHSFFGLPLEIQKADHINTSDELGDLCNQIDYLVIDEISMVRADVLDAINRTLQFHRESLEPFGGVKTILVGDLHQLPPILRSEDNQEFHLLYQNPYFFNSNIITNVIEENRLAFVEFNIPYRQHQNDPFLKALDKISSCNLDLETDTLLKTRILNPNSYHSSIVPTILTPYRETVKQYNMQRLSRINLPSRFYHASVNGSYTRKKEEDLPNHIKLELKVGAKVVFLKNDPDGNWINGTTGTLVKLCENSVEVEINGEVKTVTPVLWNEYRYTSRKGKLEKVEIGGFEQLPLKLGWALTIHKSQGLTLDHIFLDLDRKAFAYGQVYVALSRVRQLDDILLRRAILKQDLIDACGIENFLNNISKFEV